MANSLLERLDDQANRYQSVNLTLDEWHTVRRALLVDATLVTNDIDRARADVAVDALERLLDIGIINPTGCKQLDHAVKSAESALRSLRGNAP